MGIKVIVERYADPRNEVKKGHLVTICMEATLLSLIWKWNRGTGEGGDSTPPVSKGAFNPSRTVKTLKRAKFRQMKLNQFNDKRFEKATATMVDYYICNLICYVRPLAHTASPNVRTPYSDHAKQGCLFHALQSLCLVRCAARWGERTWSPGQPCPALVEMEVVPVFPVWPGPWSLVPGLSLSLSQMWLRG